MGWMNLTPAQAAIVYQLVFKLCQPAKVQPVIIPGKRP